MNPLRIVKIILVTSFIVVLGVIGIYFANPSGTDTRDPRGRLLGYIPYKMAARGMAPTLVEGEIIVASTFAYRESEPQRGDIIVFSFPQDRSVAYVKRVVALAGDTLVIENGTLILNGKPVAEPYVDPLNQLRDYSLAMQTTVVSNDMLFVLGDNRDNSNDSRFWGYLPRDHVIGKVIE
ncbi:MAG: signal peptidase I [Granulosicoccaceae bacterium]|jgi:signal peptidase I